MDSENLKKRMSQIELEISEMNDMIDKNLGLGSNDAKEDANYPDLKNMTAKEMDQYVEDTIRSDDDANVDLDTVAPLNSSRPEDITETEGKKAIKTEVTNTLVNPAVEVNEHDASSQSAAPVNAEKEAESKAESQYPAEHENKMGAENSETNPVKLDSNDKEQSTTVEASTGTEEDSPRPQGKTDTYPSPDPKNKDKVHGPGTIPRVLTPRSHPFRVVSIGSQSTKSTPNSRVSSSSSDYASVNIEQLQKTYNVLSMKCIKLQKEIDYLTSFQNEGTLTLDDRRRLSTAISKLQEYLDKKNKTRYETGVLLSRQIRRNIDMGNNGQFWVGRA